MPRSIETLPSKGGRPPKYDWDGFFAALDNGPAEFIRGTDDEVEAGDADYSAQTSGFVNQFRTQASERGGYIDTRTVPAGVAISFTEGERPSASDDDEDTGPVEVEQDEDTPPVF